MSEEVATVQKAKMVLIAPSLTTQASVKAGGSNIASSMRLLTLRHPRTKLPALYGMSSSRDTEDNYGHGQPEDSCNVTQTCDKIQFLEVQSVDEEFGAWVIGESILGEPRSLLHMCTPADPLFIIIPYLVSASGKGTLLPLDDLVHEALIQENLEGDQNLGKNCLANYEDILKLSTVHSRLHNIADQVGSKDLNVWRWNEGKALSFLAKKVRRLERSLRKNKSSIAADGSVEIGFSTRDINAGKRSEPECADNRYLRLAWEIVSNYLVDDIGEKLAQNLRLNLQEPQPPPSIKKPKLEGPGSAAPLDDYTKGKKALPQQLKSKAQLSAKEKAVARASTGTKSITSFFQKK